MALGDSESASRGVDDFMELPANDMEEKGVQRLHYGTVELSDCHDHPGLPRVDRRTIRQPQSGRPR